jgi:hypothetical protein
MPKAEELSMQYLLKQTDPNGDVKYVVIMAGFEKSFSDQAVQEPDLDKDVATRFSREDAERWIEALSRPGVGLEIEPA